MMRIGSTPWLLHRVSTNFLNSPDITAVKCPVTVMTGSHDILATPDMIQQFKAENDWINMHIIENAAHALHWEQSEQFIACVLTALQGG